MSIESAKQPLDIALEGLAEMKQHLMAADESFETSAAAADRTHTGFGDLMIERLQEAVNSFTSATGILTNTTFREFGAAQKHMMESGIRSMPSSHAHTATVAMDTATDKLKEFVDQSDAAGATLEDVMTPLVNTTAEKNGLAANAASRPIRGTDKLPELIKRVGIGTMMIENFRETL